MSELLLAAVGVLAGGVAAVSGFGIGSLLTPALALQAGTKLAVAAVAIPRAIGTAQRGCGGYGGAPGRRGWPVLSHVPKESFVATATAIALFVDTARLPIYLVSQGDEIARLWPQVLIATGGVITGTLIGSQILSRLSQELFRRVLAVLLLGLGAYMLWNGA